MDELGYDGIGFNEHHTSPYGLMNSPNIMVAAAALISFNRSAMPSEMFMDSCGGLGRRCFPPSTPTRSLRCRSPRHYAEKQEEAVPLTGPPLLSCARLFTVARRSVD